jgi:hypothetical protein
MLNQNKKEKCELSAIYCPRGAWALACFEPREKMAVAAHTQHSQALFSDTYFIFTASSAS